MSDDPRLHELAAEASTRLTAEILQVILPELAGLKAEHGHLLDPEFGTYTMTDEMLDSILLTAVALGLLIADEDGTPPSDLIIPIDPEEAMRIVQGLFGNGTTITLTVVRDQNPDS
jgi:hypothetical protein